MTENRFQVEFRFDGRLADEGEIDGSDHEAAISASRRLLALNAHCCLSGKVPASAVSESKQYHVRHLGSRKGSHTDFWAVVVNNAWTVQIVGGLIGAAYANEVKAGVNVCARFLRDSIKSALNTGPGHLPEFPRVEPVFEAHDGNWEPMIDMEAEQEAVRLQLREITIRVLHEVARPVGRSASKLTVVIDGEPVAVIDEAMKRRWLSEQIGEAVAVLRDRQHRLVNPGG